MAELDLGHAPRPLPIWLQRRNGGGGPLGAVKGALSGIQRRVSNLSTTEFVLVAAGGVLLFDHLIAPKGTSFVSKTVDKISGSKRLPAPPPPLPAARGDFAGANLMAGWNRGTSPYGPWAVANPMVQYAHAAQRQHQWATEEPWAFSPEYPWSY
jgi:hypothetical protein